MLWIFLFMEAVLACYRKYRSAKNKMWLSEFKKKKLEMIPLQIQQQQQETQSWRRQFWEQMGVGRLASLPVTSVQVSPYRSALPEQSLWRPSMGTGHHPLRPCVVQVGEPPVKAVNRLQGAWRSPLAVQFIVDPRPCWSARPLSEAPTWACKAEAARELRDKPRVCCLLLL